MTDRREHLFALAEEAAALIEWMHRSHERLVEILCYEMSDEELRALSDEWYVELDEISTEGEDGLHVYTTLEEWAVFESSGGDGGEHWLVPPRRPLRIEDVIRQ